MNGPLGYLSLGWAQISLIGDLRSVTTSNITSVAHLSSTEIYFSMKFIKRCYSHCWVDIFVIVCYKTGDVLSHRQVLIFPQFLNT